MEAKIQVRYEAGQSRYSTAGVEYMLATIGEHELYAEIDPRACCDAAGMTVEELNALYESGKDTPEAIDDAVYFTLRAMILEQAKDARIPTETLVF